MKTLLAISAAPNEGSNSDTLLEEFSRGASDAGVKVIHVHLYDLHLPYFNYGNRKAEPPDDPQNKDVKLLQTLMMEASGIAIASPVWNFSIPAVLKNMLDRISFFARVTRTPYSMKKHGGLSHLHCYYIFTTGVPWYGWLFDSLAYYSTKITMWYFGAKNHGLLKAHNCGNGSKNVVRERPELMTKAYKKGFKFAKKYL
jgi:multimeric flavodoxin WrbA